MRRFAAAFGAFERDEKPLHYIRRGAAGTQEIPSAPSEDGIVLVPGLIGSCSKSDSYWRGPALSMVPVAGLEPARLFMVPGF